MVGIQLHPKVLKVALLALVRLGALYWCRINIFGLGSDKGVWNIIHLSLHSDGSLSSSTNQEWCTAVIFLVCQSLHISSQSGKFLTLTFHSSMRKFKFIWCSKLAHSPSFTNSSRQYHLLIHFSKQIQSMKRWWNWVRTWPTNQYRVLKWRKMKPISWWDSTDLHVNTVKCGMHIYK